MRWPSRNRSASSSLISVWASSSFGRSLITYPPRGRRSPYQIHVTDREGLLRASVVNVSQIRTIDRTRLVDRVGVVGADKMREVINGLALLLGTDEGSGD